VFGSPQVQAAGTAQTNTASGLAASNAAVYGGTILGGGNPTNTGQKTLLGQ
jgi:hypothetical protein